METHRSLLNILHFPTPLSPLRPSSREPGSAPLSLPPQSRPASRAKPSDVEHAHKPPRRAWRGCRSRRARRARWRLNTRRRGGESRRSHRKRTPIAYRLSASPPLRLSPPIAYRLSPIAYRSLRRESRSFDAYHALLDMERAVSCRT